MESGGTAVRGTAALAVQRVEQEPNFRMLRFRFVVKTAAAAAAATVPNSQRANHSF